jgi:hypothetical protein
MVEQAAVTVVERYRDEWSTMSVSPVNNFRERDNAAMAREIAHLFGENLGREKQLERIFCGPNCSDRVISQNCWSSNHKIGS